MAGDNVHQRIADAIPRMVAVAMVSGLTYNEALVAFEVAGLVMDEVSKNPDRPDEELTRLAEQFVEARMKARAADGQLRTD